MLATASIGAVWSRSSPDFVIQGVLDRFGQIKPKVLFAADGYYYNGRRHGSLKKLAGILHHLSGVENVVVATYTGIAGNTGNAGDTGRPDLDGVPNGVHWDDFLPVDAPTLRFEQLPFDHPLYIM